MYKNVCNTFWQQEKRRTMIGGEHFRRLKIVNQQTTENLANQEGIWSSYSDKHFLFTPCLCLHCRVRMLRESVPQEGQTPQTTTRCHHSKEHTLVKNHHKDQRIQIKYQYGHSKNIKHNKHNHKQMHIQSSTKCTNNKKHTKPLLWHPFLPAFPVRFGSAAWGHICKANKHMTYEYITSKKNDKYRYSLAKML